MLTTMPEEDDINVEKKTHDQQNPKLSHTAVKTKKNNNQQESNTRSKHNKQTKQSTRTLRTQQMEGLRAFNSSIQAAT